MITDGTPPSFPKLTFLWEYRDTEGRLIGYVDRIDREGGKKDSFPKTFCRNEETGATAWRPRAMPRPRPL